MYEIAFRTKPTAKRDHDGASRIKREEMAATVLPATRLTFRPFLSAKIPVRISPYIEDMWKMVSRSPMAANESPLLLRKITQYTSEKRREKRHI